MTTASEQSADNGEPYGVDEAWVEPIGELFDLEEFSGALLEQAKGQLKEDGYLVARAFLVTDTKLHCLGISFDGYEQKCAAYNEVIRRARELGARAIVTLNDMYLGKEKYDPSTYNWGDLAKDPQGEAIWVTVSGPGMKNFAKVIEYFRSPDGFQFGAIEDERDFSLGLLQGWVSNGESVN